MALVVGVIAASAGLSALSSYQNRQAEIALAKANAQKQQAEEADKTAQLMTKHTGFYGSTEELTVLLSQPDVTYIVRVTEDTDLSGVPCRWLHLSNGCCYRTYDTDTYFRVGKLQTQ